MMRIIFLAAFLLPMICLKAQSYATGQQAVAFVDATRSNRSVSTQLFYPANTAGTNVALASGTEKFPVVVFGHGFVMQYSAYRWLADSLVKYGYIVVFPTTEGSISPNHEAFGRDLAFLCSRITSLNDSSASFLYNRVINKSAVAGHSMGGGASFLAASYNNSISAIFNFAAAETTPSAKQAATTVQFPALVFAGSLDCIVPDSNQLRMYSNVAYLCKSYVNITGALHCQFGNNDATCSFGQLTSGCNSSPITANNVFQKIMPVLLPFLDFYLKGTCIRAYDFENNLNALTGVTKLRDCSVGLPSCGPVSIGQSPVVPPRVRVSGSFADNIRIIPSVVRPGQSISLVSGKGKVDKVMVVDLAGKTLYRKENVNDTLLYIPSIQVAHSSMLLITISDYFGASVTRKLLTE